MSKQPNENTHSLWPMVNVLAAPLSFLILGYVAWAAINATPRVVSVASAPTFTVIDLNQNSDDSNMPIDATNTPEEDSSSDGSEPKESTVVPDPKVEPNPESLAKPRVAFGPAPNFYNVDVAKLLFEKKCSECHKLKRVEDHSFVGATAVEGLIDKMLENGLEVNEKERSFLDYYLQSTFVD